MEKKKAPPQSRQNEEADFGATIISISDEEGNEYNIEHLDTLEHNGREYMSFCEADIPDDETPSMFVFEVVEDEETGEDLFATIDDETLLEEIYELFMERLYDS
ncbi:MAG: DUF1292 domain-containing protein [Oscillospiraceae bacterium]|nr:DUF1292 domain-containing protein [Oscillospiraceae bacterium]